MYDQHPDARLEVLIEEADEPGCRAEDLSSV